MPGDAQPVLRFAKLTDQAFAPTKGSEKAAGFDLRRFVIDIWIYWGFISSCFFNYFNITL